MSIAHMVLVNQFGEESINALEGSVLPLVPLSHIVVMSGAASPTNSVTGVGIADTGSIYIKTADGSLYYNTGSLSVPTWTAIGAGTTSTLLTGLSAGAGTVASSDTVLQGFNKLVGNTQNLTVINNLLTAFSAAAGTVSASDSVLAAFQKVVGNQNNLQNGKFTPTSETISSAGALSTTSMESLINNGTAGSYAVTLAAPSSQDGQLKIIKFGTATNPATLAMTNIAMSGAYTPTGTTTLTFSITGQTAVLMAVGAKWVYLGGSAIAS